ncbi:MAG: D-alanine-D-alanine ligase [Salibacteraceae bacterium]|jgi:D-alanine-D-alanine ligase
MNTQQNIAILAGGGSSEKVISLKSASIVEQNIKELYPTYVIVIDGPSWVYSKEGVDYAIDKNDFSLTLNDQKIFFDLAFIAIHGTPGEDGKLQGYFDIMGVKYSSSNLLASSIGFNKGVCNDYLKNHEINVAHSYQLFEHMDYDIDLIANTVGMPCFVKSNESGSSFGVNKVYVKEDLPEAITDSFKYDKQVLIESFLEGREVTCGVYNFGGAPVAMPITEIITENDFFDYEAKYKGEALEITPADLTSKIRLKVEKAAIRVFQLLNLNGVARVDFIIQNNEPFVIEANTVPGLTAESLIPQQAIAAGFTLPDFFQQWIAHSLK